MSTAESRVALLLIITWYYPRGLKAALDYLQERVEQLELSLAEAEALRQKLRVLRAEHNNLKGHDYERHLFIFIEYPRELAASALVGPVSVRPAEFRACGVYLHYL